MRIALEAKGFIARIECVHIAAPDRVHHLAAEHEALEAGGGQGERRPASAPAANRPAAAAV